MNDQNYWVGSQFDYYYVVNLLLAVWRKKANSVFAIDENIESNIGLMTIAVIASNQVVVHLAASQRIL